MTGVAYIAFYGDKWLSGTAALSLEERGALITIVAITAATGEPPEKNYARLGRRMGLTKLKTQRLIESLIEQGKLDIIDGKIYNDRALEELQKSQNFSKKQSERRSQKKTKTRKKDNENNDGSQPRLNHGATNRETDIEERDKSLSSAGAFARPEREDVSFDNFLACYPQSAGGSIEAAKREWEKLNLAEQEAAIAGASQLKNSETRYPAVFLAEKRFKVQPREKQMRPVAIPDDGTRERQIYDRACEAKGQGWWVSWLSEARLEGALVLVKSEFAAKKITNEFGRELKAMGLQVRYRNKGAA